MSEIIKTEAIVLSKLDYGDTSKIANLFTKDLGKVSVIIKGARSAKSKFGSVIDPLNYVRVVFYNKESRELQFISDAEIIEFYTRIKEDYDHLKFAYAVIELVNKLIPDNESNLKLFEAILRIFKRFDSSDENPQVIFCRFFLYFLKELGFEIHLEKCSACGKNDFAGNGIYYSFEKGLICGNCNKMMTYNTAVNKELFEFLNCLNTNKSIAKFDNSVSREAIKFMEEHLIYHAVGFKGINTLRNF